MKKSQRILLLLVIILALAFWRWGQKPESQAQAEGTDPPRVCHAYTEHRKEVPSSLIIPVLSDPKAPVYKVLKVVDGDTINVERDGAALRVRLMGIDAPEESVTRYGHPEAYGLEAHRYAQALIDQSGGEVRLTYDAVRQDRYGRDLAYVWLADGRMLNALLVADGYAYSYSSSPKPQYVDRFLALMRDARSHKRGLWTVCQ